MLIGCLVNVLIGWSVGLRLLEVCLVVWLFGLKGCRCGWLVGSFPGLLHDWLVC